MKRQFYLHFETMPKGTSQQKRLNRRTGGVWEPWRGYTYKPTRPDTDNYIKLFKDCMTAAGFWLDDAQVVDERIIKTYAENATIGVSWEEVLT